MRNWIKLFVKNEEAATALEYAVIAGVLVVVLVTVFTNLGNSIEELFGNIMTSIGDGTQPPPTNNTGG